MGPMLPTILRDVDGKTRKRLSEIRRLAVVVLDILSGVMDAFQVA